MATVALSPIIIILLVLTACTVIVLRGIRYPRNVPKRASCGQCGYEINFGSDRCPECGSDLRVVGTVTAATALRYRSNPVTMFIAWTIIVILLTSIASATATMMLRRAGRQSMTFSQAFTPNATNPETRSLPDYRLNMNGDAIGTDLKNWTIQITSSGGPRIIVDLEDEDNSWTIRGAGDPQRGTGFDRDAITQFLDAAAVDTSKDTMNREMQELADMLQRISDDPVAAQRAGWGLPGRFGTATPKSVTANELTSALLHRGHGTVVIDEQNLWNVQFVDPDRWNETEQFELELVVDAEFEPQSGKPIGRSTTNAVVNTPVGWPLTIACDHDASTWVAKRGDDEWDSGSLPITNDAVKPMFDRLKNESDLLVPVGAAEDTVMLINLTDNDLPTLFSWTPPLPEESRNGRFISTGGGGASTRPLSMTDTFGMWMYFGALGVIAVLWLYLGVRMLKRRARLIRAT
ncbi:MAG: hypothetical protein AAF432_16575 [Planctomycetota bacterium]